MIMKRIALMIALIAAFAVGAVAQPKPLSKEGKEKIFCCKAQMMQKKLDLKESQMEEFLAVYKQYQEAVSKIVPPKRLKAKDGEITSDQAYENVMAQLKFKKEILAVQEEYVGKMKNILTPKQLMRFLQAEYAVQKSIFDHKKARGEGKSRKGFKRDRKPGKISHQGEIRPDSVCCPSASVPTV